MKHNGVISAVVYVIVLISFTDCDAGPTIKDSLMSAFNDKVSFKRFISGFALLLSSHVIVFMYYF